MLARILPIVVIVVAACSSPPKPKPRPPDPDPAPVAAPDAAPPQTAEADLCPKLIDRVKGEDRGGMDPDKFAKLLGVLEKHCPTWPEQVRRCLLTADKTDQKGCVGALDPAALSGFTTEIAAALRTAPDCPEITGVDRASLWLALPVEITAERDRDGALRSVSALLRDACDAGWPPAVRICVADSIGSPRSCLDDGVAEAARDAVDAAITRRLELYARATAWKPTDRKIGCDKVVAAHYGDKQWVGKLGTAPRAKRKQMIRASAKALAAACKAEKWSPYLRGCIVAAATADERGWCIDTATRWTYPVTAAKDD